MPTQLGKASVYLLVAYFMVTLLGFGATLGADALFHPPSAADLGVPVTQAPAYLMTLPIHPLLNLLVWPWFAWAYLAGMGTGINLNREMLRLAVFWTVTTMVVDPIGWVLIPHPWQMTFRELYIDYQPWISLIYLVIFGSPLAVLWLSKSGKRESIIHSPVG